MEAVPHLPQPAVDKLDELEALLVSVDETERVLLRLHRDELLVLPASDVGGLTSHLGAPARNIEEHPQVQGELRLLLVVIPDEGVGARGPAGELAPAPRVENLLSSRLFLLLLFLLLALLRGAGQLVESQPGEVGEEEEERLAGEEAESSSEAGVGVCLLPGQNVAPPPVRRSLPAPQVLPARQGLTHPAVLLACEELGQADLGVLLELGLDLPLGLRLQVDGVYPGEELVFLQVEARQEG